MADKHSNSDHGASKEAEIRDLTEIFSGRTEPAPDELAQRTIRAMEQLDREVNQKVKKPQRVRQKSRMRRHIACIAAVAAAVIALAAIFDVLSRCLADDGE